MKTNKYFILGVFLLITFFSFTSVSALSCDDNIRSWWKFNEGSGTNVYDFCGRNNGTLENGILWTTGVQEGAIYFDGIDDYVNIPYSSNLNLTDDYTIIFSFKPSVLAITDTLLYRDNSYRIRFPATDPTRVQSSFYRAGWKDSNGASNSLFLNEWNFITVTVSTTPDDEVTKFYVNGTLNSTDTGKTGTGIAGSTTANLILGGDMSAGSWYTGILDNVILIDKILNDSEVFEMYEMLSIPCEEDWVAEYTSCNTTDQRTKYYIDQNTCGTNYTLPVDNGTVEACDYCIPNWYCSIFDNSCSDVPILNPDFLYCLNVTSDNYGTCCAVTGLSSDCSYNLSSFTRLCGDISLELSVPSYPYVELNITYPMYLYLYQDDVLKNLTDFTIFITDPYSSVSNFSFTWDSSDKRYEQILLFSEEGNYPFVITAKYPYDKIENITGVFMVREGFDVTFRFYNMKKNFWEISNVYKNDFAYVTAELTGDKTFFGNAYDNNLEQFLAPLTIKDDRFRKNVFYAPYDDGEATIRLYEADEYAIRLMDGEIVFASDYSKPNISDSYGVYTYVGKFDFSENNSDQSFDIYLSYKDLHPYGWLMNVLLFVGIIMTIIVSIILFFMFPEMPITAFLFGIGFTIMFIIARIVLFFWLGW